jgi:hypothetical protein
VYRIKNPALLHRFAIIVAAVSVATAAVAAPAIANARPARASRGTLRSLAQSRATNLAQDEGAADDETEVPADQVNKYIAVYSAMQKNHGLTVDQAAPQQGLTVDQFRNIEDKIGRNPVIHERVLDALNKSKSPGASKNSSKSESGKSKTGNSDSN